MFPGSTGTAPPFLPPPVAGPAAAPPPFFPPAAGTPATATFLQQNPNYKTQMCPRISNSGFCCFGERCTYAHGPHELRKRTCTMFSNKGSCKFGDRCMYAHTETMANRSGVAGVEGFAGERVQKPPLWKSRICSEWVMMGHCPRGGECADAHGYAELKKYGNQMAVDGVAVPSDPLPNHKDTAAAAPSYPPLNPTKDVSPPCQQGDAQTDVPEPRRLKKYSGIYADWPGY